MRRPSPRVALAPGLLGLTALFSGLSKDRVAAALHGSDILGLVAGGFCLGIAFTVLITWYLERKERKASE